MSGPAVRALLLAVALLLGTSVAAAGASGAPATRTSTSSEAAGPVQRLAACLASGAPGDLLLVLDTSGSLQETDPRDQRVTAARYLVQQLAGYVDTSGVSLDLAVASFAGDLELSTDWAPLAASSTDTVLNDLDSYRDRDSDFETDYWNAVAGARQALSDRRDGTAERCQAWVWFTDGQYDLDPRTNEAKEKRYGTTKPYAPDVDLRTEAGAQEAVATGRRDLCRPGGLADQMRVQGIITLAVGLASGAGTDLSLMDGIATGAAVDGAACGQATTPVPGHFLPVDRIDDLLFAFDDFAVPDNTPIGQTTVTCAGAPCAEGTHEFVLDASITKVHVLAGSEAQGLTVQLVSPEGTVTDLTPGSDPLDVTQPAYGLTASWLSDATFQMDLTRTAEDGWTGAWRLVFLTPEGGGSARSNVHLYGDVVPAWTDPVDVFELGDEAQLTFGLSRADGSEAVDASALAGEASLSVALVRPDGTETPVADGLSNQTLGLPVTFTVPADGPGAGRLRLTLQLTTASAVRPDGTAVPGTRLEPQSVDYPVSLTLPPQYPTLPSRVMFAGSDEPGEHRTTVPVTGAGCAFVPAAVDPPQAAPDGVRSEGVRSPSASPAGCASGSLDLVLTTEGSGNGLLAGTVRVMVSAENAGAEPLAVDLPYEIELSKPLDAAVFYPLLVGLVLAGLLVPVALLYLAKWLTARFGPDRVLMGSLHGRVDGQTLSLDGTLNVQQLQGVSLSSTGRRELQLAPSAILTTRAGLALTEPGFAIVTGRPGVSSARPSTDRSGTKARLSLAVTDSWVVLLDAIDPGRGPVHLVLLLAPESLALPELLSDAQSRAGELVAALRDRLGLVTGDDRGSGGAADEWGGSPSGQGGPTSPSGSDSWSSW